MSSIGCRADHSAELQDPGDRRVPETVGQPAQQAGPDEAEARRQAEHPPAQQRQQPAAQPEPVVQEVQAGEERLRPERQAAVPVAEPGAEGRQRRRGIVVF